ncbi:UNVERIFIED_CONTAM: hypothetical protein H355_007792 [Colinus virginianus]|nr:hypothetical protein H355_007792 [Colinus virginianus]
MDSQKDVQPPKQQPMIYICGVMGDESTMYLLDQGTTKTYQIPIGHLEYKFIEKCTDVKHLEKILRVLRSGEEGCYPDLTLFCEKRIEHLDPGSRVLRKDKPAATAADFTAEEWETINGELMVRALHCKDNHRVIVDYDVYLLYSFKVQILIYFQSWVAEMNEDDDKPQFLRTGTLHEGQDDLPPIRCSSSCLPAFQNEKLQNKQTNKKNIPRDYSEWDKFDVEKECSKIDEGTEESNSKARFFRRPNLPLIEKKVNTTGMTKKEKIFIATREKEKGNEAFASGDYVEAVTYYTRSISVLPTAAAYNNKAQAEIKLQDWDSALQDCEKVLDMEPGNVKALMRRATVYNQLKNYQEAVKDLYTVLCIEPGNAVAKKSLLEIEKKMKELKPAYKNEGRGKRILIQEIEDSEVNEERGENGEECGRSSREIVLPVRSEVALGKAEMGNAQRKSHSKGGGSKLEDREAPKQKESNESGLKKGTAEKKSQKTDHEGEANGYLNSSQTSESPESSQSSRSHGAGSLPHGAAHSASLPPAAAKLKSEGNELFRSGQFGEAVPKYSEAIEYVISVGEPSPDDLSVLYSNRAACYLKEGNCSDCIQDCNRALELQPFSLKPLLRRAMAYESMERYRQAYVDYKTVLQIDSSIQAANDSVNRITRTLIDQDGSSWREKLPPIPVVPVAAQLHRWDGGNFTSEVKPRSTTDINKEQLQMNRMYS